MSCSSAAAGTELEETDEALASSSYGASYEKSMGASDDGVIHSLVTTRHLSKPTQASSLPLTSSSTASTETMTGPELRLSFTNTRPAVLNDVVEEVVTPYSSNPSYNTSSGNANPSTTERRSSYAERNKRLSPLAALKMWAESRDSSASSSVSTWSNLSTKEKHREERAMFEMVRARVLARSPQALSGYVLLDW